MSIKALDSKINIGMFAKAMFNRFNNLLATTMTAEEKLDAIIKAMEKDVQEQRVLARQIGAQMRAIADPETDNLEPLEAFKARRVKLVALGGKTLKSGTKNQLGQIQQEIKSLDAQIASQQSTFDTLAESYELAKGTYQEALNGLETVKRNGSAMIKAIEAQKAALALRDKAASRDKVDTGFLDELTNELNSSRAELRTDKAIDDDLDATSGFNIDVELSKMDAKELDADLMAEFQAVAEKK